MTRLLFACLALAFCGIGAGHAHAQSPAAAQTSGFAAITAYGLRLDTGTKTSAANASRFGETAAAGAATLNKASGTVTAKSRCDLRDTEALTTAAGTNYTLPAANASRFGELANSTVAAGDQVYASVALGSATAGTPVIATIRPGAGTVAIPRKSLRDFAEIRNDDSTAAPRKSLRDFAVNGTLRVSYFVIKG